MNGIDPIARAIAIFSGVLSALSLALQFIRHRQDKARIKIAVEYEEGELATPYSGRVGTA